MPGNLNWHNGYGVSGRDRYLGQLIWGRVRYERQPGTNTMVRRVQPRAQWTVTEAPDLRIVSDSLWQTVRTREQEIRALLKGGNLARGPQASRVTSYGCRDL